MPIRMCMESRCGNEATYRGRCRVHARGRERQTHHNKAIYNTKRWAILRDRYLFDHPLCECGCGGIAEDVHHKHAIGDGGDPWDPAGLEALTHSCHSRVTRQEQATR